MIDAVVVGAGVIGLTTAIRLQEAGLGVRVLTALDPLATTSVLATAMVGPTFGMAGVDGTRWEQATLRELAATPGAPGPHQCRGRFAAQAPGMVPPGAEELAGYEPCAPEELPAGYESGFWAVVPLIDMPVYLGYLVARFTDGGGEIERVSLGSLAEAVSLAPRVANCSGLGARALVPDPEVVAWRGPKITVVNPGIDTFFITGPPGPVGTSYHPHGDTLVLGGSMAESDDVEPHPAEEAAILARCAAVEPRLLGARVLEHRVGLRPGRASVRVEAETIDGVRVVHNYGHGGLGVTLSWGCADEVVQILTL